MSKQFVRKYVLLKDTPATEAGHCITWDARKGVYQTFMQPVTEEFSLELVETKPDWFKPITGPEPYYPPLKLDDSVMNFLRNVYEAEIKRLEGEQ